MLEPALLAIGLVLGLLILIPARRLRAAGLSAGSAGLYTAVLWVMAALLAIRPGATRLFIPVLLAAYLLPFAVSPERLGRILRRGGAARAEPTRPPMKNVTPREERIDDGRS